eukprot:SAG11_NODE_26956_length_338_cov_11.234310_1_plen_70_part_10
MCDTSLEEQAISLISGYLTSSGEPIPDPIRKEYPKELLMPSEPPYRVLLVGVPVLQLLASCTVLFFFVLD